MIKAISVNIKDLKFSSPRPADVIGDVSSPWQTVDYDNSKRRPGLDMSYTGWTLYYNTEFTSDKEALWELRQRVEKDIVRYIGKKRIEELEAQKQEEAALEALHGLKDSNKEKQE